MIHSTEPFHNTILSITEGESHKWEVRTGETMISESLVFMFDDACDLAETNLLVFKYQHSADTVTDFQVRQCAGKHDITHCSKQTKGEI